MNSFDIKSIMFGMLLMSVPFAYMLGKRHSAAWEVTASVCSAMEQKRNEQINTLLKTQIISEQEQQKPITKKGG